ncbi:hypothetical protein SUGI_0887890, partial [Cryptomeria japonica]
VKLKNVEKQLTDKEKFSKKLSTKYIEVEHKLREILVVHSERSEEEDNEEFTTEDQRLLDSDVLTSVFTSRELRQGFLYGQGMRVVEIKVLEQARELAKGSTVYVNLEPGDCHGDVDKVSQNRATILDNSPINLKSVNTLFEVRVRGEQSRMMENIGFVK